MDENRPMTKRERQEAKRLEKLAERTSSQGTDFTKWILIIGSVLFIAAFGLVVFLIKQNQNKPIALSSSGHFKGASSAKVTLVEFGDFECPACRAYEPLVQNALKDLNGKIKLQFKHFPLTSVHPNALLSAIAAEAAGLQNKFWEMHDTLYENQAEWGTLAGPDAREKMISFAKDLGLDMEKFKKDLDKTELKDEIMAQENEGIAVGVAATPTFFLDNKKIETNPQNYDDFLNLLKEEVKRVENGK